METRLWIRASVFLLTFLPLSTFAAAWTLPEGKSQIIQSISFYRSTDYYGSISAPYPPYTQWDATTYGEYGLTDKLTIGAKALAAIARQNGDQHEGLNLVEFFTRYLLFKGNKDVISIQPLLKLPGTYNRNTRPNLGAKQADQELRLLWGSSAKLLWQGLEREWFRSLELAYRHRSGAPGDEIHLDATLGLHLTPKWMILGQGFGTFAVMGAGGPLTVANSSDYHLIKLQLSAVRKLNERWSLQIGGFTHAWGENTGTGGGGIVALWANF